MKSKKTKIIVGIVLIAIGGFNSTLDVGIRWHYFANGIIFGVGLSVLVLGLRAKKKIKSKLN